MKKIISTIIVIIITSILTYLLISKNKSYNEFYDIDNNAISSVNKVTGLKIHPKIEYIKKENTKIYKFNKVDDSFNYSVKYANYLWKNEGYYITSNDNFGKSNIGKIELAKNSLKNGEILRVNVDYNTNNSFTVVISLVNGSLLLRNTN